MKTIDWNPDFSVGVHLLDRQHKQILDTINVLLLRRNAGTDAEIVSDVLTTLTRYASDHFRAEEELLRANGYPKLAHQTAEHSRYQKTVVDLCLNAMARKNSVPGDILSFLQEWWVHHILEEDMDYRQFLNRRGVT